jgi:hypothetical protein
MDLPNKVRSMPTSLTSELRLRTQIGITWHEDEGLGKGLQEKAVDL